MSMGGAPESVPDQTNVPFRRRRSGLAPRLMAAMGLALLPLAVLSYTQSLETERVADARARAAILGETMVAGAPQSEAILRGSGVAAGLAAAMPDLIADPARCKRALAQAQAQSGGAYSFISYWRRDGTIECASDGKAYDFSKNNFITRWLEDPRALVDVNLTGPVSDTAVVIFSHPVRDAGGQVTGFVTISAPHAGVAEAQGAQDGRSPLALITFGADGKVLTSSLGLDKAPGVLPAHYPLDQFAGKEGQSFLDTTASGRERVFAVVPLAPGKLYLLGSWPSSRLDEGAVLHGLPAFVFPFLMWAASLLVAWIAAEGLVIRHVRSLRNSITIFSRGARKVQPLRFERAASELRDVGDAYEAMTAAILHDEADLENIIHQKEVLLREVHHRVKNNLQLIASILNMQLRHAKAPETREAMRNVQDRVISLATIHRELYQTSGLTDVRADELLPQIVVQILRIGAGAGRASEVKTLIEPIRLTPDQAVPLALFLTEGMANVMKHGTTGKGKEAGVSVQLVEVAGGRALFSITNSIASVEQSTDRARDAEGMQGVSDGFGSQLLRAFALQLDGQMIKKREGNIFTLSLDFPVRPLTEAEERSSQDTAPV